MILVPLIDVSRLIERHSPECFTELVLKGLKFKTNYAIISLTLILEERNMAHCWGDIATRGEGDI